MRAVTLSLIHETFLCVNLHIKVYSIKNLPQIHEHSRKLKDHECQSILKWQRAPSNEQLAYIPAHELLMSTI